MTNSQRLSSTVLLAMAAFLLASPGATAADCGALSAYDCQLREARVLKENYLRSMQFLERIPAIEGRAEGVGGDRTVKRSLSGSTHISGSMRVDRIVGRIRLKLTSTREVLKYASQTKIAGSVRVESGRLRIYSPVDVDFWQMAALFMDQPVRNATAPAELKLQGWQAIDVPPGIPTAFNATLVGIAGDHVLLLDAIDGEATGVVFELKSP